MQRAATEIAVLAAGLSLLAYAIFNAPAADANRTPLLQFPTLSATDIGRYHVLSDATDDDVQHIVQQLDNLHTQFRQEFAALCDTGTSPGKIEVLFFGRESDYRAYTRRVAPALTGSAGCYVSAADQLAILNQTGSTEFTRARQQIEDRQHRLAGVPDPAQRLQAATRLTEWRDVVASEARASTDRLIRHEGAHQLFHAYGIESKFPVEPTWLTEGLAQYCETSPIGAPHRPLIDQLIRARHAGTLLPLSTLLNHHSAAGFFAFGDDQTEIAYAESWALTYFLMQPDRCDGFENLIRHYRDIRLPAGAITEQQREPAAVLAEHLGTDLAQLDVQWQKFVDSLPSLR